MRGINTEYMGTQQTVQVTQGSGEVLMGGALCGARPPVSGLPAGLKVSNSTDVQKLKAWETRCQVCVYKIERQPHLTDKERRKYSVKGMMNWELEKLLQLETACGIKVPASDRCCEDGGKAWLRRGQLANTQAALGI